MLMESCAGSSVSCTAAIMHGVSRPTDEWDLSCSPVLRSRMLPDFRPELLAVLNSQALMITKSSLSLSSSSFSSFCPVNSASGGCISLEVGLALPFDLGLVISQRGMLMKQT